MRVFWFLGGCVAFILALIGIPVPGLPTVPFLLLSAFCFARSSQRVHDWLMSHPRFGPPIHDWQRNGAIRPRAKRMATVAIGLTFMLSVILGLKPWVIAAQAVVLLGVLAFIWTRPNA